MDSKLMVMVALLATVSLITAFTFDESLAQLSEKELKKLTKAIEEGKFEKAEKICDKADNPINGMCNT